MESTFFISFRTGLFIDLVKTFDTVLREALFAVLRRFGLPGHFLKVLMRLHFGAKAKVKNGEDDSEVDSTIGVRQGSCEGSVLSSSSFRRQWRRYSGPVAWRGPSSRPAKAALP